MLLVSSRKDFTSTVFFGPLMLRQDNGDMLTTSTFRDLVRGKRVAVLVHGYHNDYANALDAYKQIEAQMQKAAVPVDVVIGFFWPGSWADLGFWPARLRATKAGSALSILISILRLDAEHITIETHSLGARVALEALKLGAKCDSLILTAPAVDHTALANEFRDAVGNARRMVVAYSHNDPVLKWAYRAAMGFRSALGLIGPSEDSPAVIALDFSNEVKSHGGYKSLAKVYDLWRDIAF